MAEIQLSTLHAPVERAAEGLLQMQARCFVGGTGIYEVLSAVSVHIVVLNSSRQVVFANRSFISALGLQSNLALLGKRLGEAIGCIHARDYEGGCGTSEACRYCSAGNLILKSIRNGRILSGEMSITFGHASFQLPMNMFETVVPVQLCGETFYLVTLLDVSDSQKRRVLERLFFHDILNTSGALKGLVGMLKEDAPENIRADIEFVEDSLKGMVDDITGQRQILDAENSELQVEKITLRSEEVLDCMAKLYKNHEDAVNKVIHVSGDSEQVIFKSDYVLLKRILGNMIKNALEATEEEGVVLIGCTGHAEEAAVEFWVWNKAFIPRKTQLQIFNRSFSTKSINRGIGTYSMKLFGERYLNGKVGFNSTEEKGTRFYIRLPLSSP